MKHLAACLLATALLATALCACKGEHDRPGLAPAPSASSATASAHPDDQAAYPDAEIPVDADFEADADKTIDASNYKAEIDRLDADIGPVPNGVAPVDGPD